MKTHDFGVVQPSQQHVSACVKEVEWVLGVRGLRMMAAFLTGILVEVTQEAGGSRKRPYMQFFLHFVIIFNQYIYK